MVGCGGVVVGCGGLDDRSIWERKQACCHDPTPTEYLTSCLVLLSVLDMCVMVECGGVENFPNESEVNVVQLSSLTYCYEGRREGRVVVIPRGVQVWSR